VNTLNRQLQYSAARLKDQRFRDAVNALAAAEAIAPRYADTHYQLGIAYEQLGQNAESAEHFQQALDLDTLRFRADTQINARIRRVAERFNDTAFSFVDSETAFKRVSQPRQPGWNLLLEHVHYSFEGNYLLANGFASAILSTLDASIDDVLLPAQEVARRIGYPNFTTIDAMGRLLDMVQTPPFTGQSNYAGLVDFINATGASRAKQVGSTQDVIQRRQTLIATGNADWQIHYELAELFRHQQDPESALQHLRQVIREYPHHGSSHLKLAEVHQAFGRFKAAIPHFEQALYYTRDDQTLQAETLGALASAHLKAGDPSKAKQRLLQLIATHSDEIELSLRAYGTLVKSAVEEGAARDVNRHLRDLENYAQTIVHDKQLEQYPLLPQRMVQILSLAGRHAEARRWAQLQPKPKES
jgi:tetratricopeptide (TPR) repeat protein